jgi:hypothetical protein
MHVDPTSVWLIEQADVIQLDLATGARTVFAVDPMSANCVLGGDPALVSASGLTSRMTIWSRAGAKIATVPDIVQVACTRAGNVWSAVTLDGSGAVAERTLDAPTVARELTRVRDGRAVAVTDRWIVIATATGVTRFDREQRQTVTVDLPGVTLAVADRSGAVWIGTRSALLRWDGATAPRAIEELREPLMLYPRLQGGVLVLADDVFYQLAGDGTIELRRSQIGVDRPQVSDDRGTAAWLSRGSEGVAVLDLSTGVSRIHGAPHMRWIALDPDGRRVVAAGMEGGETVVDQWRYEVPAEPGAIAGWLDRVTNAEVAAASDVITWQ